MQKLYFVLLLVCLGFISCETITPKPDNYQTEKSVDEKKEEQTDVELPVKEELQPQKPVVEEIKPIGKVPTKEIDKTAIENEVIAEFGDVKITKKDYHDTMSEIKKVVEGLNKTTATKDYGKWLTYLSEKYKAEYSKPSTLRAAVENLKKKNVIGLKLTTLKDYFTYIFVAARQNIRVDDIEFLSPTKVNVIMITSGKKLLVYDLEKINNRWLLVPRM